jgi:hypothetical protein
VVNVLPKAFVTWLPPHWESEQQKDEELLHSYVLCYLLAFRQQNPALSTAVAKRKLVACNRLLASSRRLATHSFQSARKHSTAYAPSGWYRPQSLVYDTFGLVRNRYYVCSFYA